MTNEMKQLLNAVTMQVNATIDAYNESTKNKDLSCGGKRGKEAKEARREAGLAAVEACDEVSCGKALEFYSHTRVWLQTIKKIEADGRVIGAYVRATTIKPKTPHGGM